MLGRGLRVHENKTDCLFLDFAGNIERLGTIDAPHIPKKLKGRIKGDAPVKICPECYEYVHASVRICPLCNFKFPPNKIKIDATASKQGVINEPFIVDVNAVTYARHVKIGSPDSVCIKYRSGLTFYKKWIPVENSKGRFFLRKFWTGELPLPYSVQEFIDRKNELKEVKSLEIVKEGKYFRIKKELY